MPLLTIPENRIEVAKALFGLQERQWEELLASLKQQPSQTDVGAFATQVLQEIRGIPNADDILQMVLSLCGVRFDLRLSAKSFVEEIRSAAKATGSAAIDPDQLDWDTLSKKLEQLFSDESSVCETAKLRGLSWDRPNVYSEAKLISDLRPVFGTEVTEPPQLFLMAHSLRITFHDGERIREMFFSLEPKDLRALNGEVARALSKEEAIVDFVTQTGGQMRGMDEEA